MMALGKNEIWQQKCNLKNTGGKGKLTKTFTVVPTDFSQIQGKF